MVSIFLRVLWGEEGSCTGCSTWQNLPHLCVTCLCPWLKASSLCPPLCQLGFLSLPSPLSPIPHPQPLKLFFIGPHNSPQACAHSAKQKLSGDPNGINRNSQPIPFLLPHKEYWATILKNVYNCNFEDNYNNYKAEVMTLNYNLVKNNSLDNYANLAQGFCFLVNSIALKAKQKNKWTDIKGMTRFSFGGGKHTSSYGKTLSFLALQLVTSGAQEKRLFQSQRSEIPASVCLSNPVTAFLQPSFHLSLQTEINWKSIQKLKSWNHRTGQDSRAHPQQLTASSYRWGHWGPNKLGDLFKITSKLGAKPEPEPNFACSSNYLNQRPQVIDLYCAFNFLTVCQIFQVGKFHSP